MPTPSGGFDFNESTVVMKNPPGQEREADATEQTGPISATAAERVLRQVASKNTERRGYVRRASDTAIHLQPPVTPKGPAPKPLPVAPAPLNPPLATLKPLGGTPRRAPVPTTNPMRPASTPAPAAGALAGQRRLVIPREEPRSPLVRGASSAPAPLKEPSAQKPPTSLPAPPQTPLPLEPPAPVHPRASSGAPAQLDSPKAPASGTPKAPGSGSTGTPHLTPKAAPRPSEGAPSQGRSSAPPLAKPSGRTMLDPPKPPPPSEMDDDDPTTFFRPKSRDSVTEELSEEDEISGPHRNAPHTKR